MLIKIKSLNIPSSTNVIVDTLIVTAFYLMRGSNYVNFDIVVLLLLKEPIINKTTSGLKGANA